ncbi:hypothetical protein [Burkholderia pseudomallei]|uniref:hypothetical protein n=1 Tax=Burkholderia pseudomallei TaxID=28450 RepID=UPI000A1A23DB|nr:hypothetical protein [Burkholderia pseudomallei]ARL04386.1 hypothetical protein BOC44_21730 [Burkholderia pseudomallei]
MNTMEDVVDVAGMSMAAMTGDRKATATPLSVDVSKDEVLISGTGSLTTYNWKPDGWGKSVKRLSVQIATKRVGDVEHDVYRVLADDGHEGGGRGAVLVDDLGKEEAIDLVHRIQDGIKERLGIAVPPASAVELAVAEHVTDEPTVPPLRQQSLGAKIGGAVRGMAWGASVIVLGIAVLCVLAFALPVAYKASDRAVARFFPTTATSTFHESVIPALPLSEQSVNHVVAADSPGVKLHSACSTDGLMTLNADGSGPLFCRGRKWERSRSPS